MILARKEIFYFSDTGDLTALRYADWKLIFLEQPAVVLLTASGSRWDEGDPQREASSHTLQGDT